jgi:hypothetical protein
VNNNQLPNSWVNLGEFSTQATLIYAPQKLVLYINVFLKAQQFCILTAQALSLSFRTLGKTIHTPHAIGQLYAARALASLVLTSIL